jgi:serine/threonine protein kinase
LCSEAKALAQIRHRNVCQVFDVGQSHGRYYISMALISGQSLAARLRERPMDCREAAALVQKLADALAAAHAAGIIHRDLKPQNVMLDGEGEPLLTDFGLARPIQAGDHLTGSHSPHGTPAYMAPELLRGEPASTASDIYALGAILYQALTGRLPFHGTMPDILTKIARGNPTPPSILRPEIDDELERICLKAMARRPSERYAYARQVADALAAYLQSPRKDSKHSRVEQWMTAPAACSPPQAGAGDHSLRHRNSWLTVANLAIVILVCANCMLLFLLYSGDHHGVLVLEVSPDNASVLIDQQVYRFEPPRDAILLPAGEHRLEVKRQGFCGESSLVRIERGKKVELNVKLKPE